MRSFDVSGMIVIYNFVVGVLMMLSSEKIAAAAGHLNQSYKAGITRVTHLVWFTLGMCAAVLSASIYVAFHLLRIGV